MHSCLTVRGRVTAILHKGAIRIADDGSVEGDVVALERGANMVVNVGLDYIVELLGGLQTVPATYLALGSNNSAPQATDTTLTSENTVATCVRKLVTPVAQGGGSGTLTFTATWGPSDNVGTTTGELGLFTAITGGTLIAHFAFGTPFPSKDSSTSLTIQYALTAAHA